MSIKTGALGAAVALAVFNSTLPAGAAPTIVVVDAPGAGTGSNQGTWTVAIDKDGDVAGYFVDSSKAQTGFLRRADGTFVDLTQSGRPQPSAIAKGARTTGENTDSGDAFIGAADGSTESFGIDGMQFVLASDINKKAMVVGSAIDSQFVLRGFLRKKSGKIRLIDAPGAGAGRYQGTWLGHLTDDGTVCGFVSDSGSVRHALLRGPDGHMTVFDPPGATSSAASAIAKSGDVAGAFLGTGGVWHGFVRSPDGSIVTFDAPGAGTGAGQGTIVEGGNARGALAGEMIDSAGGSHGFLRTARGHITVFDVPGALTVDGFGTSALAVNDKNEIVGTYTDSNFAMHGYIRLP